eukprot:c9199_g1_i1.p1 GENE.c9199_g1_i1~~c9199_g1_i1.p1  ORF type:complete len:918 (-),score=209.46 c9199_g1_i1:102-2855(-)
MAEEGDNVKVAVRIRPLIHHEVSRKEKVIVSKTKFPDLEVKIGERVFTFDYVFHLDVSQDDVYKKCITPLANSAMQGYNVTIFAYGQTGSGKTYSMGTEKASMGHRSEATLGIVPRFTIDLFRYVHSLPKNQEMQVTVTFMELYNEQIVDLLDPSPIIRDPATGRLQNRDHLQIKEDATGVNVAGLVHVPVTSAEQVMENMDQGVGMRATASTQMNSTSSRSHAIFTLHIKKSTITVLDDGVDGETEVRESTLSKIHFVDLAGSERLAKTGAEGKQLKEGISINLGLLALGNVINTLADEKKRKQAEAAGGELFVPYRDSKLTRILQDSLGGNSKTLMLACASPAAFNYEETLNTLRYADRARCIKNKAHVNRDAVSEQIHNLKQQIKQLQVALVKEHFNLGDQALSHDQVMQNADFSNYISTIMDMKVDVGDDEMPSVFTDYNTNPLGGGGGVQRRGPKPGQAVEEVNPALLDKAEVQAALQQLRQAEEKMSRGTAGAGAGGNGTKESSPRGTTTGRSERTATSRTAGGPTKRTSMTNANSSSNINLDAIKKTLEHYEELQDKHNALSLQQAKLSEERGSLLTNMTHMAAVFDRRGDYEFALEMYQRALAMKESSLGPDHPSTAATLWSMAEVCGNRRDYNNALHLFQRALSILEDNFGNKHKDVAIILNNIALVHSHSGNDEHALFVYKKALGLKVELLGADSLSVADTRLKMGKVYNKLQQYDEAMEMYNQALQIQIKDKGQDSPITAETLEEMASISFKQSKLDSAINYYMRALTVREVAYGKGNVQSLDTLRKLSTAYEMKKDHKLAYQMLEKLLVVQEKSSQTKATKEANALLTRATASGDQAAQRQAMELYQRAVVEHKEETASILGRMGAAAANFDKKKAIEAYQRALQIKENPNMQVHKRALDVLSGH